MHSFRTSNMHTYTYSYIFAIPTQIPILTCLYMETLEHISCSLTEASQKASQPARQTDETQKPADAYTDTTAHAHTHTHRGTESDRHAYCVDLHEHTNVYRKEHMHIRRIVTVTPTKRPRVQTIHVATHVPERMSLDGNLLEANICRERESEKETRYMG